MPVAVRPVAPLGPGRPPGPGRPGGGAAAVFARALVRWRWAVVLGWVVLTFAAVTALPAPTGGGVGDLDDFAPGGNPYVATEVRSAQAFGFPLLSRTVVVQHDPEGLSPYAQAGAVLRAAAINEGQYPELEPVLGALPLLNSFDVFPGAAASSTTALTYLFIPPEAGLFAQTRAAEQVAPPGYRPRETS